MSQQSLEVLCSDTWAKVYTLRSSSICLRRAIQCCLLDEIDDYDNSVIWYSDVKRISKRGTWRSVRMVGYEILLGWLCHLAITFFFYAYLLP